MSHGHEEVGRALDGCGKSLDSKLCLFLHCLHENKSFPPQYKML